VIPIAAARPSTALRRAVLAFSLREPGPLADLVLRDSGITRPGGAVVRWRELIDGCGPDGPGLVRRVARWLRLRHRLSVLALAGPDPLLAAVRPLALPIGHAVHPGPCWPVREVLGGSLELGLGLAGVDDDGRRADGRVGVLPLDLACAAGADPDALVAQAERYLADMALLAAERLLRSPATPLRPLGDCDVVTLLAAPAFRTAIVRDAPGVVGLRSAAVPVRRRGWLDLGRVDPAFALTAASLTDEPERGFLRPLLITADEVVQVRDGGNPERYALSDPLAPDRVEPVQRLH
jgi:hypothetical protein